MIGGTGFGGRGTSEHGTQKRYAKYGCRCDICKAGVAQRSREYRAQQAEAGLLAGDPRHGTVNGYINFGCRCEPCRESRRVAR